jgi:hypothetical protein
MHDLSNFTLVFKQHNIHDTQTLLLLFKNIYFTEWISEHSIKGKIL